MKIPDEFPQYDSEQERESQYKSFLRLNGMLGTDSSNYEKSHNDMLKVLEEMAYEMEYDSCEE